MMSDDHTALLPLRKEVQVPPKAEEPRGGATGGAAAELLRTLLGTNALQLMGTLPDLHPEDVGLCSSVMLGMALGSMAKEGAACQQQPEMERAVEGSPWGQRGKA